MLICALGAQTEVEKDDSGSGGINDRWRDKNVSRMQYQQGSTLKWLRSVTEFTICQPLPGRRMAVKSISNYESSRSCVMQNPQIPNFSFLVFRRDRRRERKPHNPVFKPQQSHGDDGLSSGWQRRRGYCSKYISQRVFQ